MIYSYSSIICFIKYTKNGSLEFQYWWAKMFFKVCLPLLLERLDNITFIEYVTSVFSKTFFKLMVKRKVHH